MQQITINGKPYSFRRYACRIKHDAGTITLIVTANDPESATSQIMNAEKCPRRAIVSVKEITR